MKRFTKIFAAASLLAFASGPAFAQWVVFDPSNFTENILQASRALQQINNQIQSLQNEATMLANMSKNLQALGLNDLGPMLSDLHQIDTLIHQPTGIAFDVGATQSAFGQYWPQSYAPGTPNTVLQASDRVRWQDVMAGILQSLSIGAQIVHNAEGDNANLSVLVGASQTAAGNLEATQATNQLLALSTKQQLQTQSLMAAQYRAESLNQADEAEAEVEGQAAFQNFMGSASAYTPQ